MQSSTSVSGPVSYLATIRQQNAAALAANLANFRQQNAAILANSTASTFSSNNGFDFGEVRGGGNVFCDNLSSIRIKSGNVLISSGPSSLYNNKRSAVCAVTHRLNNINLNKNTSTTTTASLSPTGEEKYSKKVFVGGLPPDIDEASLHEPASYGSTSSGGFLNGSSLLNANKANSVWATTNAAPAPNSTTVAPRAIVKTIQSIGGSVSSSPVKSLSSSLSSLSINNSKQNSPLRPILYQPSNVSTFLFPTSCAELTADFDDVFHNVQQASAPMTPTYRCFPQNVHAPGEVYSRKVFVGGLPIDIDEDEIRATFCRFGPCFVDWPHKAESKSYFPPKGYAFLIFEQEASVQLLMKSCMHDGEKYYILVSSPTVKAKAVQLRPWNLVDSDYYVDHSLQLDPRKTIFVGGVPRPLKALELATIMDRLYGGVCYAGIDTDPELKYPKGAGRVAFSNQQSYIAAIAARFVQLQHGDIPDKRAEVKPYVLDDQVCDECNGAACGGKYAPFFCANVACLQYYCEVCWAKLHSKPGRENHKPLVKEGSDRPRVVPFKWM